MAKNIFHKYKNDIKNAINDLKHKETFYKQIPNLITIARPLGMIPANILFFTGHPVAAMILTSLLLSTDFIDGKLARRWNVASKLGADLDAVGDKIIFLGMSLPLIVSNQLFMLNVLFELAIAYVNIKGRIDELDTKTVYSGKIKTCFLSATLLSGYLVQFFKFPLYILQIMIILTSITQSAALQEYVNNYDKMKANAKLTNYNNDNQLNNEKIKEKNNEEIKQELIKEKEFLLSTKEIPKENKKKKKVRKK